MLYSARFSPDGSCVLTASWDHTVGIFARHSAEPILRHRIHEKAVLGAEWGPDGASVVSTSGDGTARIWPSDPVQFARRRGRP